MVAVVLEAVVLVAADLVAVVVLEVEPPVVVLEPVAAVVFDFFAAAPLSSVAGRLRRRPDLVFSPVIRNRVVLGQ